MSFILVSSSCSISCQGSKWTVVIAGRDGLDCVALGSTFVLGVACWSVGGDGPFLQRSRVCIVCRRTHRNKIAAL